MSNPTQLDTVLRNLNAGPLQTVRHLDPKYPNLVNYIETVGEYEDWVPLKGINPPVGGWRERTIYLVEAKFGSNNPPSRYFFYSGFLNGKDGWPGGYNEFFGTEDHTTIRDAYWLQVIAALPDSGSTFWEQTNETI